MAEDPFAWSKVAAWALGGATSIVTTIITEWLRRPRLQSEIDDVHVVFDPPRQATRSQFLRLKITNKDFPRPLRWLKRCSATKCRGEIVFRDMSGRAIFKEPMTIRWSGSPEPVPMELLLPNGVRAKIYDNLRFHLEQKAEISPGESATMDVAAQFEDEPECYGWSNEQYRAGPVWRLTSRAITHPKVVVEITIFYTGGVFRDRCYLVNPRIGSFNTSPSLCVAALQGAVERGVSPATPFSAR